MEISREENNSIKILSDVVVYNKYAKYIPALKRRETFEEIIDRYEMMMLDKYPHMRDSIKANIGYIRTKKILPSMRALQFAGTAIAKNEARIYNCCYLPVDDYRSFSEILFLLLGGTGVGFSVQKSHVEKLPTIKKPTKDGLRETKPKFDFSDIRPKGARLVSAGGKAPGPDPLKKALFEINLILDKKNDGDKLSPLEVHDIVCHLADAVLAGGIRRAALISLFSADDEEMLACKYGNWWESNPQRGRANNSAVLLRHRITKEFFLDLWKKIELSGSGEPGIYLSNNKDWGANPCCEIALRPYQFCNLTEVNVSDIESQEDLNNRVGAAAFFGTLQAGFTDFHYLRPVWRKTTEKDALIGVGMTGIGSGAILPYNLKEAAEVVKNTNSLVASKIGINPSARMSTIKPSGTTSLVLGCSSGIHAWHNDYYIRRMQMSKTEDLYKYLAANHPSLVTDYKLIPNSAVLEIPIRAPKGSILRKDETALSLLERVKRFSMEWVREGHVSGDNTHNVSATISIKPDEWAIVGEWMWNNREYYNGLSVLPYDGGTYFQAPFEDITEDTYNKMLANMTSLDLTKIVEDDDATDLAGEVACGADGCEVK